MKGLLTFLLLACSTLGAGSLVNPIIYRGYPSSSPKVTIPYPKVKPPVPCNEHMGICLTAKSTNKLEVW